MFRKREKKSFPAGTFIPTPARVCAIVQLCLAFTVLLWNLSQPFAGELFAYKSKLLLYEDVLGISSQSELSPEKRSRLELNRQRFATLPTETQQLIKTHLEKVQQALKRTFFDKMERAFHIALFEMPSFEQAWLLLSFIIPILLLKKVEGALQVVWLLPMLAGCYALDNRLHGRLPSENGESHLYPTEQVLVEHYLKKPLPANIFEQRELLLHGWQLYLIETWARQIPSKVPEIFHRQAETGEFAFNVMRLEHLAMKKTPSTTASIQDPLWLLALYFLWNFYFASITWKHRIDCKQ